MEENFSITSRLFANVIDLAVAGLFTTMLFFIMVSIFGQEVADIGYWIGGMDIKPDELLHSGTYNHEGALRGEIYGIICAVLGLSVSHLIFEASLHRSLGVYLLKGIFKKDDGSDIETSDAIKRFFARLFYFPIIFVALTNGANIIPNTAIIIIWIITFILLKKYKRNAIELITETKTVCK